MERNYNESPFRGGLNILRKILSEDRSVYLLILAAVITHFIFRGLLYVGAPNDDAEQLLFSQAFDWGYDVVNPPLYTWLVILAQEFVGVSLVSLSIVKFPIYGMTLFLFFRLSLRVLGDKLISSVAAFSVLLLYYFG